MNKRPFERHVVRHFFAFALTGLVGFAAPAFAQQPDTTQDRPGTQVDDQRTRRGPGKRGPGKRGMGRGMGHRMGGLELMRELVPPRHVLRHADALGLSDDQRSQLEELARSTREDTQSLRDNLRQEVATLTDLLARPRVDEDAALRQADRVMQLENQLKRAHLEAMIASKNVLTAEQQQQYFELRDQQRTDRRERMRQFRQRPQQR